MERQPHNRQEAVRRSPQYFFAVAMLAIPMILGGCGSQPAAKPDLCKTTDGFMISCEDMPKTGLSAAWNDFLKDLEYGIDNAVQYEGPDPNPPIKQLVEGLTPHPHTPIHHESTLKHRFQEWLSRILSGDKRTVTETNRLIEDITDGFPTIDEQSIPDLNR